MSYGTSVNGHDSGSILLEQLVPDLWFLGVLQEVLVCLLSQQHLRRLVAT